MGRTNKYFSINTHDGPRFSWNNGQYGQALRLAQLDRFYTHRQSMLGIYHKAYFIHAYPVRSDHSPVQLEILIRMER